MFSPIRSCMSPTLNGGQAWELEGSFMEKDAIASQGRPVVSTTQRWVTIRDAYTLDVADGIDPAWPSLCCGPSTGGSNATDPAAGPWTGLTATGGRQSLIATDLLSLLLERRMSSAERSGAEDIDLAGLITEFGARCSGSWTTSTRRRTPAAGSDAGAHRRLARP